MLTFMLLFQDEKYAVTVYKRVLQNGQRCWEHLAGLHSHYKPIRSILFGVQLDSNEPRLLSLGEDRQLVCGWESLKGSRVLWLKSCLDKRGRLSPWFCSSVSLPTGCLSAWPRGRSAQGLGMSLCSASCSPWLLQQPLDPVNLPCPGCWQTAVLPCLPSRWNMT